MQETRTRGRPGVRNAFYPPRHSVALQNGTAACTARESGSELRTQNSEIPKRTPDVGDGADPLLKIDIKHANTGESAFCMMSWNVLAKSLEDDGFLTEDYKTKDSEGYTRLLEASTKARILLNSLKPPTNATDEEAKAAKAEAKKKLSELKEDLKKDIESYQTFFDSEFVEGNKRVDLVADRIAHVMTHDDVSLVTLQEADKVMLEAILKKVEHMSVVSCVRERGPVERVGAEVLNNVVLVNSGVFSVRDTGWVKLSSQPMEDVSATVAELTHVSSSRRVRVVCAHLSSGPKDEDRHVQIGEIKKLANEGDTVVVGADFNSFQPPPDGWKALHSSAASFVSDISSKKIRSVLSDQPFKVGETITALLDNVWGKNVAAVEGIAPPKTVLRTTSWTRWLKSAGAPLLPTEENPSDHVPLFARIVL